jgi:hypothetical protein
MVAAGASPSLASSGPAAMTLGSEGEADLDVFGRIDEIHGSFCFVLGI